MDSISDITLHTKENTFSITIDITDIMFLVILSECESHHDVSPIDRGINGQQLRFPYTRPGESGPRLNNREDVFPYDLVKSRSYETGTLNCRIALKFDRHIGSTAAEVPAKFWSDRTILNTNLAASRLYEILRKDVFSDIETGPRALRLYLPHLLPNHVPFAGAGLIIPFVG